MTYFIDTNVPTYAAGRPSEYKDACARILAAIARGIVDAATDTEMLQELAYRYAAVGRLAQGLVLMRHCATIIPRILPVELEDVSRMGEVLETTPSLPPRDALHYAIMRRHGITTAVTADRHFSALPGIVRIDPRTLSDDLPL